MSQAGPSSSTAAANANGANGVNGAGGSDADAEIPPHIAALYSPGPGPFHTNLEGKLVTAPLDSKEALLQASVYLEDWLDVIEALPLEIQRNFSLIRELDSDAQASMRSAEASAVTFLDEAKELTPPERMERIRYLTDTFARCVQQAEDKVSLAVQTYDMVDRQIRKLDEDLMKYEQEFLKGPKGNGASPGRHKDRASSKLLASVRTSPTSLDRTGRGASLPNSQQQANAPISTSGVPGKRLPKKRQEGSSDFRSPKQQPKSNVADMPDDPNEPRYCYCNQISYGEMVACDNDDCDIEWFHYDCVGLKAPPKGKWYCNECADRLKKSRR